MHLTTDCVILILILFFLLLRLATASFHSWFPSASWINVYCLDKNIAIQHWVSHICNRNRFVNGLQGLDVPWVKKKTFCNLKFQVERESGIIKIQTNSILPFMSKCNVLSMAQSSSRYLFLPLSWAPFQDHAELCQERLKGLDSAEHLKVSHFRAQMSVSCF